VLVLSRKPQERVVVGEGLVVTVLSIEGGRVRLGFEAPESVSIRREELVFEMPAPQFRPNRQPRRPRPVPQPSRS